MTAKTKTIKAGFDPAIPLEQIHQHPKNPRRNATASDELVASVKAQGLMQALVVAPHPEIAGEYVLIAGHRRRDALTRAGAKTAKAEIRDDLVTEVDQIEAMLIENSARADLTAIEEAEAYEQLQLFNLKPADIARATGRSRQTVASRLKLLNLGEASREKLHEGQVTIDDALALAELPKAARDQVEGALGTSEFRWKLATQRDRIRQAEKFKADVKVATELGILPYSDDVVDPYELQADGVLQRITGGGINDGTITTTIDKHTECLRWCHVTNYNGLSFLVLVCADPESHGSNPDSSDDPDREAREAHYAELRAEAERQAEDRRVAARLRWETLEDCSPGNIARALLPLYLDSIDRYETTAFDLHTGVEGTDSYRPATDEVWERLRTWIDKSSDEHVVLAVFALLADVLTARAEDMEESPFVAAAFAGLRDMGHQFSDVDVAQEAAALGNDPEAGDE